MTQKICFTKDRIVDAAFALTREQGWTAVTARNVARRLSSSTMPIYSSLKTMSRMEREVRRKAERLLLDYQRRPGTQDAALNAAVGYVAFARREPNLFRFLYVDRPLTARRARARRPASVSSEEVVTGRALPGLADQVPLARQDRRILKCWIFIHGLASMIGNGVLSLSDTQITSLLLEAGGALFRPAGTGTPGKCGARDKDRYAPKSQKGTQS